MKRTFYNPFIVFHAVNIASAKVIRYLIFPVFFFFFNVIHSREIGKFLKRVQASSQGMYHSYTCPKMYFGNKNLSTIKMCLPCLCIKT